MRLIPLLLVILLVCGSVRMSNAQQGPAKKNEQAATALTDYSSIVSKLKDCLQLPPAIAFDYTIKTGISERKMRFISHHEKFRIDVVESDVDVTLKTIAFDGTRYFALYEGNYLVVTRDPENLKEVITSWFSYNPLFNWIRLLNPDTSAFGPPFVNDPELWNQIASNIQSVNSAGADSVIQIANGTFPKTELRLGKTFLPTTAEAHGESKKYRFAWKVNGVQTVDSENQKIELPTNITCSFETAEGAPSPFSYILNIIKPSLTTELKNVDDNQFRIGISEVDEMYDIDLDAKVKTPDWKQ